MACTVHGDRTGNRGHGPHGQVRSRTTRACVVTVPHRHVWSCTAFSCVVTNRTGIRDLRTALECVATDHTACMVTDRIGIRGPNNIRAIRNCRRATPGQSLLYKAEVLLSAYLIICERLRIVVKIAETTKRVVVLLERDESEPFGLAEKWSAVRILALLVPHDPALGHFRIDVLCSEHAR